MEKRLFLLFLIISRLTNFAQTTSIYVSDAGNFSSPPWQILKYDEDGTNPMVFIDTDLSWPQDIVFVEDSNFVLVSNLNTGRINRYDSHTGEWMSTFASGISGPTRMKIGMDGNLYVLQWSGSGLVKKFDLAGNDLGDFTSVGVPQSIGLDWDTDGNLYVSSYNGDYVRKFDSEGNDLGLFIDSDLVGPTNIWFAANGDLLVLDYDGGAVKRFDGEGIYLSNYISGTAQAEGIDTLSNGNVLVGNGGTAAVKMYTPDGDFIVDLVPSGSGDLIRPNAVVVREYIDITAIDEYSELDFKVTPTIGEQFIISGNLKETEDAIVTIYAVTGRIITSFLLGESNEWDATEFSEGTYVLTVKQGGELLLRQKIVVGQ